MSFEIEGNDTGWLSRRKALMLGAGAAGSALLAPYAMLPAWAADHPALGTYPEGSSGDSVFVGIAVPRTGTYAAQGEDEIKGYELAIEHLNSGSELMSKISSNIKKGVLGKQVKHGIADNEAKPNTAVQAQSRFISENKAVMITGSVSSAVAVAINKLAQKEKVIYLPCISGSNDTTGKDCTRYSFRECFYAQTAAQAIAPILVKNIGKGKKIAFLTPDYTYGHTVRQSMEEALGKQGEWTVATNQISPLGTTDFSTYLLNVANSGADVVVNINFGRDAVLSIKQAKQFGILGKMTLVMPYNTPFIAEQVDPDTMAGVYAGTDYWWTLANDAKYPLAKMFNDAFSAKYGANPEWGANAAYMQIAMWADAVERAGSFYPPDVIAAYEKGVEVQSTVGPVKFRPDDHQLIRPVIIVKGKKTTDMKSKDDFYDIVEVVDGGPLMQAPNAFGCKLGDAA
ncbi:branched-chain amino acid ABC transporter substrate-binding protein [Mesorhizobium loti NZP2037]|nr:branched-chain amino acid ABC transporter substrate-binding protein [Mesorhizobium loti NZP2037]